jgi:hypothetical protein
MTADDMLAKVTNYFGREKDYSYALLDRLRRMIGAIAEDERDRVIERLYEDHEASRVLSIKALAETCRALGVAHHDRHAQTNAEAVDVECGACEFPYRWRPSASDFERVEDNVHATCPRCGWPHSDELRYRAYCAMGMQGDAAYHATYSQQTEWCRKEHLGIDPRTGNAKKPAWSRAQARDEIAQDKRRELEAKLATVAAGKTQQRRNLTG